MFSSYLEFRKMNKVPNKPSDSLSVTHHRQNPLESTGRFYIIRKYSFLYEEFIGTQLPLMVRLAG
jgi:hypothetical protein